MDVHESKKKQQHYERSTGNIIRQKSPLNQISQHLHEQKIYNILVKLLLKI